MMTQIFESIPVKVDKETTEQLYVYSFNSEDIDDFDILTHNEKLSELGFKEESTTNASHATLHRYDIITTECFVTVTETTITY